MGYIIVNITENGMGQLWNDKVRDNTAEAVLEYLDQLAYEDDPHLLHAEKCGRFMVGTESSASVGPSIIPTTVRFYEVTPAPPVPRFAVSRI